ncbi:MAG TPA: PD-(D/E)XK nuclease family protein [Bryobacteraceae bacterium]|nr:PD-(D/E)XK nuclease family protein [Bryobacteraceae bacterium]
MLLLTGPPGSGKTQFCLDELRRCLRARASRCVVLVPASTLAEHVRNRLAREGLVFSPSCVDTFGHFVETLTPGAKEVGSGTLGILVERYLRTVRTGRYAAVRDLAGFRRALASAIESFAGAGGSEESLRGHDPEFAATCSAVLQQVAQSGWCTRAARLQKAAEEFRRIDQAPSQVWITGFSGFTPPEAELIRAIAQRSELTVALVDSPAAARTVALLRPLVREHREFSGRPAAASCTIVPCSTPENEAAEIARRILDAITREGRRLTDIAVVLRTESAAANLRLAFERFGVPAYFHLGRPLQGTPPLRFLNALLDAAHAGWDHQLALAALRMHGSPLEREGDVWEYAIAERLPGRGLDGLKEHAPESVQGWIDGLAQLEPWTGDAATATVWQSRFDSLRTVFNSGAIHDRADGVRIQSWRDDASALEAYSAAIAETAASFRSSEVIGFREFRAALDIAVSSASIWPRDRRREVVHVVDAAEARHWRLPVVYVCGLVEGEFPRRYSEDSVLPDEARRQLARAGVPMTTAAQRQDEEQFLFETALSQGTESTILTYSLLNSKGDPLTPSFALARVAGVKVAPQVLVRPRALRQRHAEPEGDVVSGELQHLLRSRYARMSASSIETFASCPWMFFARKTLRLQGPPPGIWERLDLLAQGNIAHRVAEMHFRDGLPVEDAFEQTFERCCDEQRIPEGYRTEAVRLELLHNLKLLLAHGLVRPQGQRSWFEHPFSFSLDGIQIDGKMDRVDIEPDGRAVVFDYKYSRPDRLRETKGETLEGQKVQGGIYLRALRELGLEPSGLVWFGFKREVSRQGWVLHGIRPDLGSSCSETHLHEIAATAADAAGRAAAAIAAGAVTPRPDDEEQCERCDYNSVCRYEVMARRKAAAARHGVLDATE